MNDFKKYLECYNEYKNNNYTNEERITSLYYIPTKEYKTYIKSLKERGEI